MAEPGRHSRRAAIAALAVLLPAFALAQPATTAAPQGKIIAIHGRVEHAPAARQDAWAGAQALQSLFVSDRVRTLQESRAAILFVDETQVKLNAQAIMTVRAMTQPSGSRTAFELLKGEGWFRTKNPRGSVTITTPAAAAAIRGTEIDIKVADDDTTTLTVVEGLVDFSNALGAISVAAGEEATARPGQAPTKRVILNPDNAVQWALYYATAIAPQDLPAAAAASPAGPGLQRLQTGDAIDALRLFESTLQSSLWSRLGASLAYLDRGDTERARMVIAADTSTADRETAAALNAQLAAIALATGDVAMAQRHLDTALASDPRSLAALSLSSSFALTRNDGAAAAAYAAAALAARGDSIGGRVAAAEAAQAAFHLDQARAHLDAALQRDPDQLRALIDRARIRFGTGDTAGAAADAARAARVRPDAAEVRSLHGFIKLSDGDVAGAEADLQAAARLDEELAEPHLGLGLVYFRRGREDDGLIEMLTATLLEPHVSLYQSYLGKAYYERRRFTEGLAALATAKRLDPRDPTPWLYASLYLRDQSRPVEALRELNEAIARNDFRAVYRSRLLLDRDLATKNVSLAQVYKQLGFVAWAAFEALRSVETDFANSSARLFLADAYINLPDRVEAAQTELLHHRLYAPVNRNSFNNFAEYTGLFERPAAQSTIAVTTGNFAERSATLDTEGGNNHVAYAGRGEFFRAMDARQAQDYQWTASGTTKFAFSPSTDLYINGFTRGSAVSEDVLTADVFGITGRRPIIITRYELARDPDVTLRRDVSTAEAGFKHLWTGSSSVTVAATYNDSSNETEDADAKAFSCLGFPTDLDGARVLKNDQRRQRSLSLQGQQVTRVGSHQIMAGAQVYRLRKTRSCREQLFLRSAPVLVDDSTEHSSGDDRFAAIFAQDEFQITAWLHLSAGVRFQSVTYDDEDPFFEPYTVRQADPAVGASIRVSPSTVIRAAAFRNINGGFVSERLAPATVAGFAVEQNEVATTARKEINIAIEHSRRRAFVAGQAFVRRRVLDVRFNGQRYLPDAAAELKGVQGAANLIISRRIGLSASTAATRSDTFAYRRHDIETTAGINFVHERRWSASLGGVWGWQRFSRTTYAELTNTSFRSANVSAAYELPRKRGTAFVSVTNMFANRMPALIDLFALPAIRPVRGVSTGITWQF